jgi:hypothetical protein
MCILTLAILLHVLMSISAKLSLTYERNVDIFEEHIMCCSDSNGALDRIHCRVRCDPRVPRSIGPAQLDVDSGLAVLRDVANFCADVVSHRLHGVGTRAHRGGSG